MTKYKTYFNWSTGKDSAMALHHMLYDKSYKDSYKIEHLLTSINSHTNRVSMHGLSRKLLKMQLDSIGLPFSTIELPENPDMEVYANFMQEKIRSLQDKNFTHAGFGDIFLEDLRAYREKQLNKHNINCVFPLWKRNTTELLHELIDLGYKAIVICIDLGKLDSSFCGRFIDKDFIKDLPKNIDPCGENGEYHTFCFEGPLFKKAIDFKVGDNKIITYPMPKNKTENKRETYSSENSSGAKDYQFCFTDLIA